MRPSLLNTFLMIFYQHERPLLKGYRPKDKYQLLCTLLANEIRAFCPPEREIPSHQQQSGPHQEIFEIRNQFTSINSF